MQDDTSYSDTEDSNLEEENLTPAPEEEILSPETEPSEEEIPADSEEQIASEQLETAADDEVEPESADVSETDEEASDEAVDSENPDGDTEESENGEAEEEESALPLASVVEAVLFAAREPLKLPHIARAVGKRIRQEGVKSAIDELNVHYLETGRAFEIAEISGKYQLMSRPEYVNHIIRIYPKRELSEKERSSKLTPAALDTLSIIAYKQPVTRGEIEHIRGVGCGPVLRALIERGSVKVAGKRTDLVGQPLMYGTTDAFLTEFGLGSLEELPLRMEFLAMAEEFAPSPEPDQLVETGDDTALTAQEAEESADDEQAVETAEESADVEQTEEVAESADSGETDSVEPIAEDDESADENIAPIPLFSENPPNDEEPPPAI